GPAGSDFGRTSPTGAINLATKRASLDSHNLASVSLGSEGHKRITADLNRRLSDASAFRLNLMAQDTDAAGRDVVEHKRWGIAPSLAFGLDGNTHVYLDLLHVQHENSPVGGVPTIGLPGYTTPDPTCPEIGNAP